jgi:hypothetical protein
MPLVNLKKPMNIHVFLILLAFLQSVTFFALEQMESYVDNKWLKFLMYFLVTIAVFYTFFLVIGFDQTF